MKKLNKKQSIIISVTGIVLVLLILLGLTYAYFVTQIQGNENSKSIDVTTAYLELTYFDGVDGIITANNIIPGDSISSKTFSVKNTGTKEITDYILGIQNVINTFSRNDDLKYTITCTSDKKDSCNGAENVTFPSLSSDLISNDILSGETQTFTFTLQYLEAGVDQSEDMNAHLEGKFQIYINENTSEVTGTVANATSDMYVTLHSNVKKSGIDVSNNFKFVGVEAGNHIISIYKKVDGEEDQLIGSKEISIAYGSATSVVNTNVTITPTDDIVNLPIIVNTNSIDIGTVTITSGSNFANVILASARDASKVANSSRTPYLTTPITAPGQTLSTTTGNVSYFEIDTTKYHYYDSETSDFWYRDENVTQYTSSTSCSTVKGKYLATTNDYDYQTIYVDDCIDGKPVYKFDSEKELSPSTNSNGTSYYFRGDVIDNFVSFAGKCWRIVRIMEDGSVKLIYNNEGTCSYYNVPYGYINTFGREYPNTSTLQTYYAISNYLNPGIYNNDRPLSIESKSFQTSINSYLDKLVPGNWCYDDTAYLNSNGTILLTNEEKMTYYKPSYRHDFYYDSYVRLNGTNKTPTFKCNGTLLNKFSDSTDMYVASLTADEVIFAGGGYLNFMTNPKICFSNDCGTSTLSLSHFVFSDYVYVFNDKGQLQEFGLGMLDDYKINFRPVIVLKKDIKVDNGNGTVDSPYVLK